MLNVLTLLLALVFLWVPAVLFIADLAKPFDGGFVQLGQ